MIMTSAIETIATLVYMASWDDRLIYLMSNGEARTERMSGWMVTYCTGDRTALPDTVKCADYTCQECYVSWRNTEVTTQGNVETFIARRIHEATSANYTEMNSLHREVEQLKEQLSQSIAVSTVQQVGAKYAEYSEWCSVYEQAFSELTTDTYPNGIPVLNQECDIEVTITFRTTATSSRRQRAGDIDFMRQSIVNYRLEEMMSGLDIFDHDFDMSSPTDISVEIHEA